MSLVQRYIGENGMARHEFKIFCPERPPGREPGPGGSPDPAGARTRREPRPGGSPDPAGTPARRGAPRGKSAGTARSAGTGVQTMIVSSFGRYLSQSAHDHEAPVGREPGESHQPHRMTPDRVR